MIRFILIFAPILAFGQGGNTGSDQFVAVHVDSSNGLSWSKALLGTYSNGCVEGNDRYDGSKCSFVVGPDGSRQVNVDNSRAAKACRDIGGRLPTKPEIESLVRNFDHSENRYGPILSKSGIAAMQAKFGDNMNSQDPQNSWFWSSSVSSDELDDSNTAFGLSGPGGGVDGINRSNKAAVRCVAP